MLVTLALFVALRTAALEDPPPHRLFELDAVELLDRGKEVAGSPDLQVKRYLFTYRFADAENRARFLEAPERYEIQLGGACARMGPLSGRGTTKIHAVHEGNLYIFASENCRDGFRKAPEKLLDRPDERPKGDEAARTEGQRWIARAVDAHGGAERLGRLRALRWRSEKSSGEAREAADERTLTVRFPGDLRTTERWGGSTHGELVLNQEGWFSTGEQSEPMAEVQRRASWRRAQSLPLVVLREASKATFVAVAGNALELAGRRVREVHTYTNGCAVTLGIDEQSGRIAFSRMRDRGPSLALGALEIRYDDYRSVAGVIVPWREEVLFEGRPFPSASRAYASIEVDPELPPSVFARPE